MGERLDQSRIPRALLYTVHAATILLFFLVHNVVEAQQPGDNEAFVTTRSGQWLEVADTRKLAIPVFTLECWIRVESSGLLVTRDIGSGTPSDWQLWYEDRRIAFITARTPPDSYFFTPDGSIVPGRWHHIALAVDGPKGSAEVYIDGVSVIQPTFSPRSFDAETGLAIGGYYDNAGGSYLHGAIDEVRFWNHIRRGSEIRNSMNRRLLLSERDGLVGYWSFCGNFADSTIYGHDLTAHGIAAPQVVTGLPGALSCDAFPPETSGLEWKPPLFPDNPCLRDTLAHADLIVYNTGDVPRRIDSITITRPGQIEFQILDDPTPFVLQPGDSVHIAVRFLPYDHGLRTATLLLEGDTLIRIDIEAQYDGPLVYLSGLPLHFFSRDGKPDTARVFAVNLSSLRSATIQSVTFTPPSGLTLLTPLPFTIRRDYIEELFIEYDPDSMGSVEATLTIVIDSCAAEYIITADACPPPQFGTLDIPHVAGTPGDTVWVPLRVKQWDSFFRVEGAVLYGTLHIDCHALYPLFGDGGRWAAGARTMPMELLLGDAGDTVAMLPFLVLLGSDTTCALTWTVDSVHAGCPLTLAGSASTAAVTGLCQQGGTRLFDAAAQLALEPPHPSPGNGLVQLRFHIVETGMTSLTLFDVRGRAVRHILHEALPPGTHQRGFDTAELTSGVYLLLLATPSQLRTQRFVVVK